MLRVTWVTPLGGQAQPSGCAALHNYQPMPLTRPPCVV